MKKKLTSLIGKTALGLLIFLFISSCEEHEQKPPNIIVFLVDDMGLMDTSVPFVTDTEGTPRSHPLNEYYNTPNMEALAAQGVRFTNFYAHSVCSPTRSSILSGQNSARHRTTNWINAESNNRTKFGPSEWNWKGLDSTSTLLPKQLQNGGYKTIHIGKAHFGPIGSEGENPTNLGFDVNIAGNSFGHPGSYYGTEGFGHIAGQKARAVPDLEKYHGQEIHLTEALTLEAKSELSKAIEEDKPFFLYLSHYALHAPFQSDPRFAANYINSGKDQRAQAYATLIEGIDKSLGDIIAHVKQAGIAENTFIIFLGDNGSDAPLPINNGYGSSEPIRGKKGNHWEGGMRVPFIASWVSPNEDKINQSEWNIDANSVQNQIGTILDLFPTISRLGKAEIPTDVTLDGFDLQTQLANQRHQERTESFLNHFPHGQHRTNYFTSYVDQGWKVIYHYPVEKEPYYELYNLDKDPFESDNLASSRPEQLQKMMVAMSEKLNDYQALYPEKDGQEFKPILPN